MIGITGTKMNTKFGVNTSTRRHKHTQYKRTYADTQTLNQVTRSHINMHTHTEREQVRTVYGYPPLGQLILARLQVPHHLYHNHALDGSYEV